MWRASWVSARPPELTRRSNVMGRTREKRMCCHALARAHTHTERQTDRHIHTQTHNGATSVSCEQQRACPPSQSVRTYSGAASTRACHGKIGRSQRHEEPQHAQPDALPPSRPRHSLQSVCSAHVLRCAPGAQRAPRGFSHGSSRSAPRLRHALTTTCSAKAEEGMHRPHASHA
jgi:hypothetical protein